MKKINGKKGILFCLFLDLLAGTAEKFPLLNSVPPKAKEARQVLLQKLIFLYAKVSPHSNCTEIITKAGEKNEN